LPLEFCQNWSKFLYKGDIIMDSMPFNRNGKWKCTKCNTWAQQGSVKCGWCGVKKPEQVVKESTQVNKDAELRKELIESAQRLNPDNQRKILKQIKLILDEQ
jgi:hypothetical protein